MVAVGHNDLARLASVLDRLRKRPSDAGGTIARVRKLIKIALVVLGIRALLRWRKRRQAEAQLESGPPPPDPAAELREKLAASRAEDATVEPEAASPEASVEDRRADVHAQGRATVDEMTSSDEA
jgi:hypothetical protein